MGHTIYSPEHRHLVALLRDLRTNAGMTQQQLADVLGRPQSYVSKIEQCERRVDLVELAEYARALGVDLVELVSRWVETLPKPKQQRRRKKRPGAS